MGGPISVFQAPLSPASLLTTSAPPPHPTQESQGTSLDSRVPAGSDRLSGLTLLASSPPQALAHPSSQWKDQRELLTLLSQAPANSAGRGRCSHSQGADLGVGRSERTLKNALPRKRLAPRVWGGWLEAGWLKGVRECAQLKPTETKPYCSCLVLLLLAAVSQSLLGPLGFGECPGLTQAFRGSLRG